MKFKIFKFDSVTSTNDIAMKLLEKKKNENGYVCAKTQTKGRGTHGRKWISNKGNLFCSVFFPLKKNYPPFNEFFIINPIIVSDVISRFCSNKKISLKWPNDVFLNGKKVCGILQETVNINHKKYLIIGIGINLISNPKINNNYKTTNLMIELKKKPSTKKIINAIIFEYEKLLSNLKSYDYKIFKKKAEMMALKY